MKRWADWTLVLFLALATAPVACGQAPGGPQGGRGAGRGLLALAAQKSVQEDLKASDDQAKSLTALSEKQREAMRGVSREERFAKMAEQATANEKAVAEILKPEQLARLKQIQLQTQGVMAFERPEVASALSLSAEQTDKIKAVREESAGKMGELRGGGGGGGDRTANRAKFEELRKASLEKVQGILTTDQLAKWKELTGEPFKGELQFGGGGGGGREPGARRGNGERRPDRPAA